MVGVQPVQQEGEGGVHDGGSVGEEEEEDTSRGCHADMSPSFDWGIRFVVCYRMLAAC